MPKIPMGNFGQRITEWAPSGRIIPGAFDNGGAALQQVGETGMHLAAQLLAEQKRQQDEVDRSYAVAAVSEHSTIAQDVLAETQEKLATGELDLETAPKAFSSALDKAKRESLANVPDWLGKQVGVRLQSVEQRAMHGLGRVLTGHRHQQIAGNLEFIRDNMAKDAGMPDVDVDSINRQFAQTAQALGPQAGIHADKIGKLVQDFTDSNWLNHAKVRAAGSRNDPAALVALETDLTAADGFYMTRLDPDKRAALIGMVTAQRMALETKSQHLVDKLEARGERTLAKIDQQIASGVPATPDMWLQWGGDTRGTSSEEAYRERVQTEQEVQRLLREPPERQITYLRERETALLQDGGSLRDKANIDRLRKALDNNRKQLEEAPLLYAQNRTGDVVKPLDLSLLVDQSRTPELAGLMADRVTTVNALRDRYGDSVKPRILLANEAEMLTRMLNQAAPDQQVELFKSVRRIVGDDVAYQGALSQIAPDSPVKALAGTLAARGADIVQTHVFSPDETISARQTAQYALLGESLLNPTRGQKAADGATRTWIMPRKADMLRRFADKVGDTFAGTPQAMDAQFEFVQATYAGMMASRGASRSPEVIDGALFDKALARTTPVMRQGGASFLKPIVGMTDDQFREKLRDALPADLKPQADRLPLRNVRSNQYVVLNGARPVTDASGKPLIVTVTP